MIKSSLIEFLDSKPLYYDKIDYNIIELSWQQLKRYIKLPYVIHIVGTNGKGSTGRFIASFLNQLDQTVLHYSSPHILTFNERIWIDGENCSSSDLDIAHHKLLDILDNSLIEQLTYFEYTTLIALYLSSKKDYIVLEAGLGGEFDATNVVQNDLTVIPTIGLDHQDFLGDTITKIATTKMKSCNKNFILGLNLPSEIISVKNSILKDKNEILINQDINLSQDGKNLPIYLQNNLVLALSVLEYLGFKNFSYKLPQLFGRFQQISQNITIDVGHNPLAAKVIYEQLLKKGKKFILIYNSYANKDYKEVLIILKPLIKEIQIIQCNDQRMVKKEILISTIENLSINREDFDIMNLNSDDYYLVFGSFIVVEEFLKGYNKL